MSLIASFFTWLGGLFGTFASVLLGVVIIAFFVWLFVLLFRLSLHVFGFLLFVLLVLVILF